MSKGVVYEPEKEEEEEEEMKRMCICLQGDMSVLIKNGYAQCWNSYYK